jgi:lipopolysaccharide biosynthesis regulator YciM
MNLAALFAIALLAIAIGWFLGRYRLSQLWQWLRYRSWRRSYMEGLSFLLNEESDQAIEAFIKSWPVNSENFDLHNALANMLRRKGEVDRAIPIHANLVNGKLSQQQIRIATIELAQDYISAGLLDRAERLLINVLNASNGYEEKALELLQQVYQLEKEWDKAITIAEQLIPKRRLAFDNKTLSSGGYHRIVAQYYCEKAQEALEDDNFIHTADMLKKALKVDNSCARALLLQAELAYETDKREDLLEALDSLGKVEPSLLIETLPWLQRHYYEEPKLLLELLQQWNYYYPSVAIEKLLFELLLEQNTANKTQATSFLLQQLKRRPTLKGLQLVLKHQQASTAGNTEFQATEYQAAAEQLVDELLADKMTYRCKKCGFGGHQLHWLCPKCQSWDSIRRIRGAEGD